MNQTSEVADAIAMIRASAEAVADRQDLKRVRGLRFSLPGFDRKVWLTMCEMGWPALRVPEARGGAGLGMSAYCALVEELGAALVPEPLIGAVLCSSLLDDAALGAHLAGSSLCLPAWQDARDALTSAQNIQLKSRKLYGRRRYVHLAAGADRFLIVEPSASWIVDASDPGVSVEVLKTQDGGHFGNVTLNGASGKRIAVDPAAALAEACLATSAYLLGLADAALARTLEYLKTRVQFGHVIGGFQALQHRAVELKLEVELTRASVEDAAAHWDREQASGASYAAVSRAKVRATTSAMVVTRQAIQLHGGIGFTDEHDIGLFLRKSMVVAAQFGSAAVHRNRFAQLSPFHEAN